MPSLTPGVDVSLRVALLRNGDPVAVDDTSTVTGRFYTPDGITPLTDPIEALSTDDGAAWHLGVVVFQVQTAATAAFPAPTVMLYVTVTDTLESRGWWIRFDVLAEPERGSALFPDRAQSVDLFRRLLALVPLLPPAVLQLPNTILWGKLAAAEAEAERALRTFFGPVEVVPENTPQAERDALDAAGDRWVEDPGHDLEPGFFDGERWGYLVTRHLPVRAVRSMTFVYPHPMRSVMVVPNDWIRIDKKYGHIRLVPGSQSFAAPLTVWTMRVMGGGRTVPHMIQVRYTAGLDPEKFPDLVDLVMKLAILRLLQGLFMPPSSSISADGLSESMSIDLRAYQDDVDARLERLRQAIHGQRVTFL